MKHLCFISVFLIFFAAFQGLDSGYNGVTALRSATEEENILKQLLSSEKYDPEIAPGNSECEYAPCPHKPITVKASMYILDISSVDDFKNEFSIQFYFRQKWHDSRLKFADMESNLEYLQVRDAGKVWKPDSFFIQERQGRLHTVIMPNTLLRIKPDGEVLYSVRLSMTFQCNMDLRYYPLDSQNCYFNIESYGSGSNDIQYRWSDSMVNASVSESIDMTNFVLTDHKYTSDMLTFSHGSYSSLQVNLMFKRKIGLFLNKLYVPFIILVIASWLSFWIKPQFTSLRLTLILAILFIMFWLESDISRRTPPVSYTKAIDVWIGVCVSLVFASLLQFIIVSQLVRKEKQARKQQKAIDQEVLFVTEGNGAKLEKGDSFNSDSVNGVSQLIASYLRERKQLHDKIDTFSAVVFPVMFAAFNVIYWPLYCYGN